MSRRTQLNPVVLHLYDGTKDLRIYRDGSYTVSIGSGPVVVVTQSLDRRRWIRSVQQDGSRARDGKRVRYVTTDFGWLMRV